MIPFRTMRNVAIFSHVRPDGDTVGSMFALRSALTAIGVRVDCFCDGDLPEYLAFLDNDAAWNKRTVDTYDTCIAVDCADADRIGAYRSLFFSTRETYNIDHHMTNIGYAKYNTVRDSASTCEIVYDLLDEAGLGISKEVATCIYSGILTDTGSFSQSNTTAHTHDVAARLLDCGIEVEWLHNRLCKEVKKTQQLMFADRVANMRFYSDDRIALLCVTLADLARFGLTRQETEGLVNYANNVIGVKIAVCMTENEPQQFKVSLRAKKGYNVAEVAQSFGGGGHIQAAGCSLRGLKEEVIERVVRQCELALPL